MTAPNFGYSSLRPNDDIAPVQGEDFSKVALCTTAIGADATLFPVNQPRRFNSRDRAFVSKLGTGFAADAIAGINAQLGDAGADICFVRVNEGTNANPTTKVRETLANIVGDPGARSGLWALRAAPSMLGMNPKLWLTPGYTDAQPDGAGRANPVLAALGPHLEATRSIACVDVNAGSKTLAIAARKTLSSDRIMPIGIAAKVYETVSGAATLVTRPMASRAIGLFIAADNNRDGRPFDSIANRPILGIVDTSRKIDFDLGDGSTEGQLMLAEDIAIVAKGDVANFASIADGGFYFVGVESCATSDLWSQIHQVRGADYLDVKMMKITREFLGGRITPRRAESWLKSLGAMLRDHVAKEDILGFELNFPAVVNSIADVQLGQLSIQTNVEPAPVFRRAVNEVRRYRPAVQALIDAIVSRAGTQSAVVS